MLVPVPFKILAFAITGASLTAEAQLSDLGSRYCGGAGKKDPTGYFSSSTEFFQDTTGTQWDSVPLVCLPPGAGTDTFYGAWYSLSVPGTLDLELETTFAATPNPASPDGVFMTSVSVFQGGCPEEGGTLECLAYGEATAASQMVAEASFPLTTNTQYFLFVSLKNVTGLAAPVVSVQPAGGEDECQYYRSQQINFDSYSGNKTGLCTPCESFDGGDGNPAWYTYCYDACDKCYYVDLPLAESSTFCYYEGHNWVKYFSDAEPILDTCYTFPDGNQFCDQGERGGTCPLSVNGVPCNSCENVPMEEQATCTSAYPSQPYDNFVADCTNVEGIDSVVDKCRNTGFEGSFMGNYSAYTSLILLNRDPSAVSIPAYQGACFETNYSTVPGYGEDATVEVEETAAPEPLTLPAAVTLEFGVDTERSDMAEGVYRQYRVDVTGLTGIATCEINADNGDIDLYMRKDTPPLGNADFDDCLSTSTSSEEVCSVSVIGDTEVVYAVVYAYAATTDLDIECNVVVSDDARDFDVGVDESSSEFDLLKNEVRLYKLEAPAGTGSVRCTTEAQAGDLDLYMKAGEMPLPGLNLDGDDGCFSISTSSEESCEISAPSGDVYMLLKGFEAIANGVLACIVTLDSSQQGQTEDDANTIDIGDTERNFDLLQNEERLFEVEIEEGTSWVACQVRSDNGDVDLAMSLGQVPVRDGESDCLSASEGGDETCSFDLDGSEQTVYVLIYGYSAVEDVRVECDGDPPLDEDDAEEISLFEEEDVEFTDTPFGPYFKERLYYFEIPDETWSVYCNAGGGTRVLLSPEEITGTWYTSPYPLNGNYDGEYFYILVQSQGGADEGSFECSAYDGWNFEVERRRRGPVGNPDGP